MYSFVTRSCDKFTRLSAFLRINKSFIRTQVEYFASFWNPLVNKYNEAFEPVQKNKFRFCGECIVNAIVRKLIYKIWAAYTKIKNTNSYFTICIIIHLTIYYFTTESLLRQLHTDHTNMPWEEIRPSAPVLARRGLFGSAAGR